MSNAPTSVDSAQCPVKGATRFVRTLLGDLPADNSLGVCDAHEHVVMHGEWLDQHFPEFVLSNLDLTLKDLGAFRAAGGGWIVDSMPTGAGRNAALLAQAAKASQIPIVCPTGVHQVKYYPPDHPLISMDRERLAQMFVREITVGVDDGAGTLAFRAGVIKVASNGKRMTVQDKERYAASVIAQHATGCPILTHTEAGPDAYEQVDFLIAHGATPSQIVLSHCDKNGDESFHRDLLQAGVCLEYDQHFRQLSRGERCIAVDLIAELIEQFPRQLLVGMDMARKSYWKGYGGQPGLAWLMTDLLPRLRSSGLTELQVAQISTANAVDTFAFSPSR